MRPTRRTFLAGTSVLALAPLLASCGEPESAGDEGRAAEPEEAAFPATITHKFGQTTVEKKPTRIAVVGLVEQDALLALGFVPIVTSNWFGDAEGRIFPWAESYLDDGDELPTVVDPAAGIPVEEVLKYQPDLIIGLYSGMTEKEFKLLNDYAPTIAQSAEYADYGMPWQESTLAIGTAVGRPGAAQELIDDVDAQINQAAAEHPEFAGKTGVCVTPYEGLFVYGQEDPRGRILEQLGFTFPEQLADPGTGEFGWSLSTERTSELEGVDAVVWLDYDTAPKGQAALFDQTDTAKNGRFFDVNADQGAYYVAQSFVTPLSIPYVLERYVPQLAAAVDGDPATEIPPVEG